MKDRRKIVYAIAFVHISIHFLIEKEKGYHKSIDKI
jgi:hypothetical protein